MGIDSDRFTIDEIFTRLVLHVEQGSLIELLHWLERMYAGEDLNSPEIIGEEDLLSGTIRRTFHVNVGQRHPLNDLLASLIKVWYFGGDSTEKWSFRDTLLDDDIQFIAASHETSYHRISTKPNKAMRRLIWLADHHYGPGNQKDDGVLKGVLYNDESTCCVITCEKRATYVNIRLHIENNKRFQNLRDAGNA